MHGLVVPGNKREGAGIGEWCNNSPFMGEDPGAMAKIPDAGKGIVQILALLIYHW